MLEHPVEAFPCRPGCGACCIAVSITTPIPSRGGSPGLPGGKPSGLPCPHLRSDMTCAIYFDPDRPAACAGLKPTPEMCGDTREEALAYLFKLEEETRPR